LCGHRCRRDPHYADRAGLSRDRTCERMELGRHLLPFRGRRKIDIEPAAFDLGSIAWHLILFVPRFSLTSFMMKLPIMPRTDDIVAVEGTFTQRATHMITDPGDRSKRAVFVSQRDSRFSEGNFLQELFLQLFDASDIRPLCVRHTRLPRRWSRS